ncbi:hypothetical protein [Halorussus caseinilyticus]|uniref:Uncharacterized protein n=1 Tax=Halorussus caseinilyticus TaxID=3034025 RepID=A0ABD5WKP4_9EURY|nr:hypothetical protein [Halorussus sp. DT72]
MARENAIEEPNPTSSNTESSADPNSGRHARLDRHPNPDRREAADG